MAKPIITQEGYGMLINSCNVLNISKNNFSNMENGITSFTLYDSLFLNNDLNRASIELQRELFLLNDKSKEAELLFFTSLVFLYLDKPVLFKYY